MNSDDVILLNDEHLDSDVAVISDTDCGIVVNSQTIDTIVIDEDNPNTDQNDDIIEIIEIDKIEKENNNEQGTCSNVFDRIVKENKLLSEFIEKCLDIEHSEGMLRVIIKSLLPVYDSVSDDYKVSPEFKKLIHAKLRAIDVDPNHKFSHLKDMCETMKCHKFRKRKKVSFVTLSNDIRAKPTKPPEVPEIVHDHETRLATKRKKVNDDDIIEVPIEYVPDPVIDLEEEPTDVIMLEDSQVPIIDKENIIENNIQENNENNIQENNNEENINIETEFTEVPVLVNNENIDLNNDNQFLVPKKSKVFTTMSEHMIVEKIKNIEQRIASYKKEIEKLEVMEVDTDTINSPYVRCERYKLEVVSMYKELCTLMGAEAVKRREIRLQVTDGRPELPVKNLERLINDNIGPDGNPHFPDFCEVVECVVRANNEAKLGLSQTQVTTEARRLFTNCGLALQQKRQQRDWRHMLGRVAYKLDNDPADADPELRARLEENKRVGFKKEEDLLNTFVKMEFSSVKSASKDNGIQISEDHSDESDDGGVESNVPTENIDKVVIENTNDLNSDIVPKIGLVYYQEPRIETSKQQENKEPNENIIDTNNKLDERFTNGCNIEVLNVIINHDENSQGNKETNDVIETNSEFITKFSDINKDQNQINSHQDDEIEKQNVTAVLNNNEEIDMLKQNIKTEPRDTLKDMALFSDNFTATIIYIEDPFLVIEISSDSSDDESDS